MARTSTPRVRKPARAQVFTRKLLAWWARAARDLPWRKTRDPYRVLVSEFIKLPGIGPYTAGAVASFAYEKPVPAVDTNVRRVLSRVFFGDDRQRGSRERLTRQRPIPPRRIWDLARALVPRDGKRAWKFNQAIMELGALICVARKPRCPQCPVRPVCRTGKARRTDAQR